MGSKPDSPNRPQITTLLSLLPESDSKVEEELVVAVYDQLRRLAQHLLRSESGKATVSATELVHEAYLRLFPQTSARWESRGQFFAVAARVMRRLLIDRARRRGAVKRGGGMAIARLEDIVELGSDAMAPALLAVNEALDQLAENDSSAAQVVELRLFAGLSVEATAEAMELSPATVHRRWRIAKAWLYQALQET